MRQLSCLLLAALLLAASLVAGCSDTPTGPTASATETESPGESFSTSTPPPSVSQGPVNKTIFNDAIPIAVSGTASKEFTVPRATRLHVAVAMNASSSGPYALYGEGEPGGPPRLLFTQGGQLQTSFTFKQAANTASAAGTIEGPYEVTIDAPIEGGWVIEFAMGASNMRAVIFVTAQVLG
jgi:hypothetical protein